MTRQANLGRRGFLAFATGTVAIASTAALFPAPAIAGIAGRSLQNARSISLINLNTQETGTFTYWESGQYDQSAMRGIARLLRDPRNGEVHAIDTDLVDLLVQIRRTLRSDQPIQIVSGYRSEETNEELASTSRGVAKNSYHMRGQAVDIRMANRNVRTIRSAALQLKAGGVGFYPRSNFVHVDTGPVRRW